ncbi:MAG: hypothetical protein IJS94_07350 [Clostridia bacterium]|nr:hypothetical protein [Clostridia bacterium]
MIKGTEKRVIRVKCDPKCRIEEAFLVMKPGWESECKETIVDEAEKLIFSFENGKKRKKRLMPFLSSVIISLAVAVLAYFAFK